MKSKKVIYTSKKTGVTKVYEYDRRKRRGGRSLVIVGENGRVTEKYKKRYEALLERIDDPATRADIKALYKRAVQQKEKLTIRSLESKAQDNRIKKLFINAGYTLEEAAESMKTDEYKLFDKSNWDKNVFINPDTGKKYQFKWSYYDTVWTEIF